MQALALRAAAQNPNSKIASGLVYCMPLGEWFAIYSVLNISSGTVLGRFFVSKGCLAPCIQKNLELLNEFCLGFDLILECVRAEMLKWGD